MMLRWPIGMIGLLVILSAASSLLAQIVVFGQTATAIVTVGSLPLIWGVAVEWDRFRFGVLRLTPLWSVAVVCGWAALSLLWYTPGKAGLQSLAVMFLWLGVMLAVTRTVANRPRSAESLMNWLVCAGWISCAIFAGGVLVNAANPGGVIGPRAFGMFATIVLAWTLSRLRFVDRKQFVFTIVAFVLIVISLGRMSIAISLLLVLLTRFSLSLKSALRLFGSLVFVGLCVLTLSHFKPLRDRFTTGDVRDISGVRVNVEGREAMWTLTFASALKSPLIGSGVGSAEDLVTRLFPKTEHPHNEYLRFWHDHGIPGLALLLLFLYSMIRVSITGLRTATAPRERAYHLASLGTLGVLAGNMITDNPLDYSFIVIPASIIFGVSLGLSWIERQRRRAI